MQSIFYKPPHGWLGDVIPFYHGNAFRLFYLHDQRDGEGFEWRQIGTEDFISFTPYGEALPRGSIAEPDRSVWTGSVMEAEGAYHLFYTGFNPFPTETGSMPRQAIMHAVSHDMVKFCKIKEHTFYAPNGAYESIDWRDPYVFWNADDNRYWMLVTARVNQGPPSRRGCLALCKSGNLEEWTVHDPFWAPCLYNAMECPDLFQMGEWWYLVFSTFSERFVTQYRMSRSLSGPWIAPPNDTFDGRAFYAAKSYSDGSNRYLFGWNPTKAYASDFGEWNWGGNLVVHQLVQEHDGTLSVKLPRSVDSLFGQANKCIDIRSFIGDCKVAEEQQEVRMDSRGQFSCAWMPNEARQFKFSCTIRFEDPTRGCGIVLGASDDLESAYYYRLEPFMNRLVFDMWPKKTPGIHPMDIGGEHSYQPGMERPVRLVPGDAFDVKIVVDHTICIVYLNDRIALSSRVYTKKNLSIGFFVTEGKATFSDIKLFHRGTEQLPAADLGSFKT